MSRISSADWRPDTRCDGWTDTTDEELVEDLAIPEALQYEIEEDVVNRIDLDDALERLTTRDRAMIELLYAYRNQSGYTGHWPPTTAEISAYLHQCREGTPLGTASATSPRPPALRTIWSWHEQVVARWDAEQRRGGSPEER